MHYIIYDLEMTNHLSEIIEIGAVKVTEVNGELAIIDQFQMFVKPKKDIIDKKITSLTGITKRDLAKAPSFIEASNAFEKWIGEEEYYLCSWGPEDKWAFINDGIFHDHKVNWLINHNDIQLEFSMLYENERGFRYGLARALDLLHIQRSGKKHRALDDAINTAKIFIATSNKMTLKKNAKSFQESKLLEPEKVVYKTNEGESDIGDSPFAKLANFQSNK